MTLVIASLLLTPFISSAQIGTRTGDARFCDTIDATESKLMAALDKNLDTAVTRYQAHLKTLEQKKDTAVAQLEAKRDQVDVKWEAQVASMKAKAKTDAQKAAVNEYVATVEALAAERRADVNAAVGVFANAAAGLRDNMETEYLALIEAHRADVQAAFDKASASCASGVAAATVAATLRTDLSAAREEFRVARQAFSQRADFTEIRKVRVAASAAAREEFRKGLEEANKKLRAALTVRS